MKKVLTTIFNACVSAWLALLCSLAFVNYCSIVLKLIGLATMLLILVYIVKEFTHKEE